MADVHTKDLTTGSPMKLILSFMLPLVFGLLFQQVYSMVDTIVVGKFLGVDALAGVGSTGSKLGELGGNYDNSTVFLCHGDCIEDAKYVENILKTKYGVKEVLINYTGAVIGSHSGPGTMAVFFLGDHR